MFQNTEKHSVVKHKIVSAKVVEPILAFLKGRRFKVLQCHLSNLNPALKHEATQKNPNVNIN